MSFPPAAASAIDAYLREVDAACPGLVDGLYVTGSLAHDDFWPAISDIDLVAVTAARPDDGVLDRLEALHRPSAPHVDVAYLTWDDLRSDPTPLCVPHSLEGTLRRSNEFVANAVLWRALQTAAVAVRGRPLTEADVWFDPDVLRRWNVDNLDQYWRGRLAYWQQVEATEPLVRHPSGLQWLVLGVPRLHYTINTLALTSKTGAGRYALSVADPRWHPVIETCIGLRADQTAPLAASPEELRRHAVDLVSWLIEDAHRLVPA